jgi:D-lactate dehydrogenase (cytochrome)
LRLLSATIGSRLTTTETHLQKTDADAAKLWEGRKVALWSAMALQPESKCWTTDVCVPISALPTLVEQTKTDLALRGLTACHVGCVSFL